MIRLLLDWNQLLKRFKIHELVAITGMVQSMRLSFETTTGSLGGGHKVLDSNVQMLRGIADNAYSLANEIRFKNASQAAWHFRQEIDQGKLKDYSTARTHLSALEMALLKDCAEHKFLHIAEDRVKFFPWPRSFHPAVPAEHRHGFGPEVDKAFPSALDDINEAGYCLAVEANTGAVYHLMCAVEHGLRALAKDRRVAFKKGPIDLQQWGDILKELDKKVADINNWPKSKAREAALEFFNRVLKDSRSFNEAYRRHIAHARKHYDRHEALSVMTHVRDFLVLLATRISEKKNTPLVWKRV